MEPKESKSARDHPADADVQDEAPEIEVTLEDFDPETYIGAILADMDREVPDVDELVKESERRPSTMIPPPSVHAVEWELDQPVSRVSRPALTPVPPQTQDEDRFTFPPPVSAPPPASSISPMAISDEDEDIFRPPVHPRRRRSERVLLAAFAAVGLVVVAVAGYDISKATLWGASWQNISTSKRVAAAVNKLEAPADPTHELQPVVIAADRPRASLVAKERMGGERPVVEIPFDPGATSMALDVAAAEATTRCVRGSDSPVSVNVRVTFDPTGRATSVTTESSDDTPPPTLACAQRVFSKVRIPHYTGDPVTFTRWLRIK